MGFYSPFLGFFSGSRSGFVFENISGNTGWLANMRYMHFSRTNMQKYAVNNWKIKRLVAGLVSRLVIGRWSVQANGSRDPKIYVWDVELDLIQFFNFATGCDESDDVTRRPTSGEDSDVTAAERYDSAHRSHVLNIASDVRVN